MKKKMLILTAGIFCFASLASAKLMLIDQTGDMFNVQQVGEEYLPVGEPVYSAVPSTKGDTTLIGIYDGSSGYYFPNRPKGSMNMQWFVPPAECKILEAHVRWYSTGDVSAYLWESPFPYKLGMSTEEVMDSIMVHWVFDSTLGESDTGWVTMPDVLHPCMVDGLPFGSQTPPNTPKWDTLDFTGPASGPIDVGADPFWFGYVIMDESREGNPWPLSDGNVGSFIPCQTFQWRTDVYEWRSYGDIAGNWSMYILVDMYGNPPPEISTTKKADTYASQPYRIEAEITDNEASIARAELYWAVNPAALPPATFDSVDMLGVYPDYAADISAICAVGDTIHYWIEAEDDSGKLAIWPTLGRYRPASFIVRERTVGNDILLVIGDDNTDEDTYTDALDLLHPTYDMWPVEGYGAPDSSVVNAGYDAIIWGTYGGTGFSKSVGHLPEYMDGGGNLFLMGMDALAGIYGYDTAATEIGDFAKEYFHFDTIIDDYHPGDTLPSWVVGIANDTISNPFLDDPLYVDPMNTYSGQDDWMGMVITDGVPESLFIDEADVCVGWRHESAKGYKWVFPYFQYGSIADEAHAGAVNYVQTRKLMCNTLTWFGLTCDTPIDVALFSVDNPTDGGKVIVDSSTAPIATVKNYGFEDAAEFDVECVIALLDSPGTVLQTDTQTVAAGLVPYGSEVVTFASWTVPSDSGVVYELTYTTLLATDECPGNDVQVIEVTGMPVGVELVPDILTFQLFQNRPNPVAKGIKILYSIPATERVTLKVYNRVGQCVRTLVNNESQAAGLKTVTWNGTDRKGTRLPSGVYFYTLTAGKDKAIKKLVLVK